MTDPVSFSAIVARMPKPDGPRPKRVNVSVDLNIALRMRRLLSGHRRTWVILERDYIPNKLIRKDSKRHITEFRLEEYVGQMKYGDLTNEQKDRNLDARLSGLRVKLDYSSLGWATIYVNGRKLSSANGWYMRKIRLILTSFAAEMMDVIFNPDVPTGKDTMYQMLTQHDDTGHYSYVRMRGRYPSTQKIARRGMVGRIHVSEPTSARHSAYPGW